MLIVILKNVEIYDGNKNKPYISNEFPGFIKNIKMNAR